ncbi:MAG: LamG domain-containing protein [Niabella sp.]|nr:LamG domain-containing protein [Niabella sp.]
MKTYYIGLYLIVLVLVASCTKANKDDDFTPGEPPPVPGGYTNSSQIATANLVGHWAFDGSLVDSVTGTNGTNKGATFAAGRKGQAYQGSATAYFTFDPGAKLQQLKSYTIAFWINSPVNSGAIGIFTLARTDDFWGNLDIYQDGNGPAADSAIFKVHMYNKSVAWAGQFTDTRVNCKTWVHLTITYDGATSIFHIYQNGIDLGVNTAGNPARTKGPKLNGSDPGSPPVTPYGNLQFFNATKAAFGTFQFQTSPSLTTGAGPQSWANNFTGLLDEFRIYDRALTTPEVAALYKLERQGR